jgi:hypothetical protein
MIDVILVFSLLLLMTVSFLLLAPFYLEIDSEKEKLSLKWSIIFLADIISANDSLLLRLRIFGFTYRIDLFRGKKFQEHKENTTKKYENKSKRNFPLNRFINVIKSFKVKKLNIDVDCGDDPLNGILFPIFYWAKIKFNKNIAINFEGRVKFQLLIKNNAASMLLAYLK